MIDNKKGLKDSAEDTSNPSHLGIISSLIFSLDDKCIISGSMDKNIKIWDLQSGKLIRTLKGHTDAVKSVIMHPNGRFIISGSVDKTIKIWEISNGNLLRSIEGHTGPIGSIAISPDGKNLISCGKTHDYSIRIWNIDTGECVRLIKDDINEINAITISPNGKIIASLHHDFYIKIWDFATLKYLDKFSGHTLRPYSVVFSPDGKYIITGSNDKTIKIWDINGKKLVRTIEGHIGWVNSVTCSPDGKYIISGSNDRTVKIWELETGELSRSLEGHLYSVESVAVSHDGKYIICGSGIHIYIWEFTTGKLLQTTLTKSDEREEKEHILTPKGLIKIFNDLKSSNSKIKQETVQYLVKLAKRGENISAAFPVLIEALSNEKEELRLLIADVLKFYFMNYISYYCRVYSFDRFSESINNLKSPNKILRKNALNYLNEYSQWAGKGIGWQYFEKEEFEKFRKNLKSTELSIRKKAAKDILDAVIRKVNIFELIPILRIALYDEDIEIRWIIAEILIRYYGYYTSVTYGYYSQTIEALKSPDIQKKISAAQYFSSIATPNIVSDSDERDISFAVPALALVLSDNNNEVKKAVLEAIENAQREGQMITDAVPALIRIISDKDKDKEIQDRAIFILAEAVQKGFDMTNFVPDLKKLSSINKTIANILTLISAKKSHL